MHHKPGPHLEIFRHRLRQLRKAAGLTQSQMANRIGAGSDDVLTRLEGGIAKGLSLQHLVGIAQVAWEHGLSLDFLFGLDDPLLMASEEQLKDALIQRWRAKWLADELERLKPRPVAPGEGPAKPPASGQEKGA